MARPPGRVSGAPQAPDKITGLSNTRYKKKEKVEKCMARIRIGKGLQVVLVLLHNYWVLLRN